MDLKLKRSDTDVTHNTASVLELEIANAFSQEDATRVAVAILGLSRAATYDVRALTEALQKGRGIHLQANADSTAFEVASIEPETLQLAASGTNLSPERALAFMRQGFTLHANGEEQGEFDWQEVDEPFLIEYMAAHGVFEYDYDEASEVIDSLSAAATPKKISGDLAQTSIVTASGETQVIGLGDWSIDWKRKTLDATTTDDAAYESSLASSKSWSVKAKYMLIDGDTSQVTGILSAIDLLTTDTLTWNFFPTVELGRAVFQGACIIDGITIAAGTGKLVGLDVSLKGTGPLTRLVQIAPVANTNTITGQQAEV